MMLLDPRFWLAAILVVAGAYGVGRWHQHKADAASIAADALTQSETARLRERAAQANHQRIQDGKDAKLRAAASDRNGLLRELRDRPDRLPDEARAACPGTSGRELSRGDAEVLVGIAERAERYRILLDACQQREAVTP